MEKRSVNLTMQQIERLSSKPNLSEYLRKLVDDDLAHDAFENLAKFDKELQTLYNEMIELQSKLSRLEYTSAEQVKTDAIQAVKAQLETNKKRDDTIGKQRLQAYDKLSDEERERYDAENEEKGVV